MLGLRIFRPTRFRLGYQTYKTIKGNHHTGRLSRSLGGVSGGFRSRVARPTPSKHGASGRAISEQAFIERSILEDSEAPVRPIVKVLADNRVRIAILGGPKVGKSSLFNLLLNSDELRSVVSRMGNTTKDVREGAASLNNRQFIVLDTPASEAGAPLSCAQRTVSSADAAFVVIDGSVGVTNTDIEIARFAIATFGLDAVTLIVNKSDLLPSPLPSTALQRLGLATSPIYISTTTRQGIPTLGDQINDIMAGVSTERVEELKRFRDEDAAVDVELHDLEEKEAELDFNLESVRLAAGRTKLHTVHDYDSLLANASTDPAGLPSCKVLVLGPANAGKSTFVNTLLGFRRCATGGQVGTTHDMVKIPCTYKNQRITLLDTAGLRPAENAEDMAPIRYRDMHFPNAHVVIYMMPADRITNTKAAIFSKADLKVLETVTWRGASVVCVINKWDRLMMMGAQEQMATLLEAENKLMNQLNNVSGAPIVVASAKTGQNVELVLGKALEMYQTMHKRIRTSVLQTWMSRLLSTATLPVTCPKPRFIVQTGVAPMTFAIFVSRRALDPKVPMIMRQFFIANLRRSFGLGGVPVHLAFLSNHPDEISPRFRPASVVVFPASAERCLRTLPPAFVQSCRLVMWRCDSTVCFHSRALYKEDGGIVKKVLRKRDEHFGRIVPQVGEAAVAEGRGIFDAASAPFARPDEKKDVKDKKKFGMRFSVNRERIKGKRKANAIYRGDPHPRSPSDASQPLTDVMLKPVHERMIGAIIFFNARGDTILSRTYRDNVSVRQLSEAFRTQVISAKLVDRMPVVLLGDTSIFFIRHENIYVVATTTMNANAAVVFSLLWRLIAVFQSYFRTVDEDNVKEHFVLIQELLDEACDFGYPQLTDAETLQLYIKGSGITPQSTKSAADASQITIKATGKVSHRAENIRHKRNEVFIDVIEDVNLLLSSSGQVLSKDVVGKVQMRTFLSGMPECKFGLNDQLMADSSAGASGGGSGPKKVSLEDVTFHQAVRLGKFDADRTISFIPPDGEFTLMSYRTSENVAVPFRVVAPRVSEMGTTRLEISFRVRAEFSHQFHGSDVIIRVPTPSTTSSTKVSVGAGKAKYDGAQKAIVWKVKRWTGGQELSFQAEVTLLSTTKGSDGAATKWSRPPIRFEFQVSMLAVSGLLVRFLKVNEPKLGYQAVKWVRYMSKAGQYECRF